MQMKMVTSLLSAVVLLSGTHMMASQTGKQGFLSTRAGKVAVGAGAVAVGYVAYNYAKGNRSDVRSAALEAQADAELKETFDILAVVRKHNDSHNASELNEVRALAKKGRMLREAMIARLEGQCASVDGEAARLRALVEKTAPTLAPKIKFTEDVARIAREVNEQNRAEIEALRGTVRVEREEGKRPAAAPAPAAQQSAPKSAESAV